MAALADQSSLDEIGIHFGTDKSSIHHDYLSFYELHFRELRHKRLSILEIGVLGGASIRTWHAYFPLAEIVGVDISPYARSLVGPRVKIEIADQGNVEEITAIGVKYGPFDIVIEDGSHMWEHQMLSLKLLFPFVRNGGLYIVEDLQTNYGYERDLYRGRSDISCVEYLKQLLDLRIAGDSVDLADVGDPFLRTYARSIKFLSFHRGACLLKKAYVASDYSAGLLPERIDNRKYVELDLMAHVSNVGDVYSRLGIDSGSSDAPLQGVSVDAKIENLLQYQVRFASGEWSDWASQTSYAGTRGQCLVLTGIRVQLLSVHARSYGLEVAGLFGGCSHAIIVGNDEECVAKSGGGLFALRIDVFHR